MSLVICAAGYLVGFLSLNDLLPRPSESVQVGLEAARATHHRALLAMNRDGERIVATPNLAPAEVEARRDASRDRFIATMTPELDHLLAVAETHPGDPAAVEALGFVARDARGWESDRTNRALGLLLRDHVRSEGISAVTRDAFVFESRPEADQLVRAVLRDNPSRAERGRACQDLAFMLTMGARRIRGVRAGTNPNPLPPRLVAADPASFGAEAEALYERCVAEFADVPVVGYGAGKTVGDFARGALADLRDLRVGRVAPEIAGEDVDGKPLRLSDHRGRVVVLVFGAEWCGPCQVQARKYHDLLRPAAQAANPCVVLEVNADPTREPLRAAIARGAIAWPCWFVGGVTGPITLGWGVEGFPTVHVLDAQGVIRAKNVPGDRIAAAVAEANRPRP